MSFPKPKIIDVNGIQLEIFEAGEGKPLVLCHGWPEHAYSWRYQIEPLVELGYHVIIPNQHALCLLSRRLEVLAGWTRCIASCKGIARSQDTRFPFRHNGLCICPVDSIVIAALLHFAQALAARIMGRSRIRPCREPRSVSPHAIGQWQSAALDPGLIA